MVVEQAARPTLPPGTTCPYCRCVVPWPDEAAPAPPQPRLYALGNRVIYEWTRHLTRQAGRAVHLTSSQDRIIRALIEAGGSPLTGAELTLRIFGPAFERGRCSSEINRMRAVLGPGVIETNFSLGYYLARLELLP